MNSDAGDADDAELDQMVRTLTAQLEGAGLRGLVEIVGTARRPGGPVRQVRLAWNGEGKQADIARLVEQALPGIEIRFR